MSENGFSLNDNQEGSVIGLRLPYDIMNPQSDGSFFLSISNASLGPSEISVKVFCSEFCILKRLNS